MAAQALSTSVILIVDPYADEREMYCEYLSSCGVAVGQASDLGSALEQVECLSPAVVTTELRLPGADGLALCKLLKARHPRMRVIAVTADGFAARLAETRAAGFDAVLVKPCLPDLLLNEIRHQLKPHNAFGQSDPLLPLRGESRNGAEVITAVAVPAFDRWSSVHPTVLQVR